MASNWAASKTWCKIVDEYYPLIDRSFVDESGVVWVFFGLVSGRDDYYYGMYSEGKTVLVTCVGDLVSSGYTLIEEDSQDHG